MNIFEDIIEALEPYYNSKSDVINVLNELHFKIFDNPKNVLSDLDEAIQEYASNNDLCPSCGGGLKYNYKNKQLECEQCDYFRNM